MVSDFETSCAFYRDTLGLSERSRVDGWAEYSSPDGFVVGVHTARPDTPLPPEGGVSIGFGVEDIEAVKASLEASGIGFHGPIVDSPPIRLAFFVDPDGYPLYIAQHVGF